jgi:hypothetical protein
MDRRLLLSYSMRDVAVVRLRSDEHCSYSYNRSASFFAVFSRRRKSAAVREDNVNLQGVCRFLRNENYAATLIDCL